jgi:hypothetical protein
MLLRGRLELIAETVQEFEETAEETYQEGKFLLHKKNHHNAGIYLIGSAAEMWLKCAYFRLEGATLTDLIAPRLGPARSRGNRLTPPVDYENYHSLKFWARLIEAERAASSRTALSVAAPDFSRCIQTLYDIWWIEMRYRRKQAAVSEAEEVRTWVSWIRANYELFWS